ncbi:MAG: CU044_5270 family protein [Actinomycetota bacterium]|nr:CU044_5270 family protein [Actinomycetota bacterium]
MTELDLLKEFCAEAAPQREQARAAARSRLLAVIASGGGTGAARPRSRSYARLALAGAVVTTGVAVAVAAGGLTTTSDGPLGQPASAAELLLRAAAVPAAVAPHPDQFIYVESTGLQFIYPDQPPAVPAGSHRPVYVAEGGTQKRVTIQAWTSVNGTRDGLVRERPCALPAPGTTGGCEYSVSWGVSPGHASPTPNPPGSYGWEATLPTSRAGLTHYLEGLKADPGTPPEARIWGGIYNLFQDSSLLPAPLRTATYELAASLSGVTLIHHVTDAAGRSGDAIALDSGGMRQELILQPKTYQVLGIQEVILTPASAAACASENPPAGKCNGTTPFRRGAVAESEAYLQVRVTDSAGAAR